MTLAHGYTINAACDGGHCKNSGQYNCQGEWYGHNKREAFAAMRESGWTYRGFQLFLPTLHQGTEQKRKCETGPCRVKHECAESPCEASWRSGDAADCKSEIPLSDFNILHASCFTRMGVNGW